MCVLHSIVYWGLCPTPPASEIHHYLEPISDHLGSVSVFNSKFYKVISFSAMNFQIIFICNLLLQQIIHIRHEFTGDEFLVSIIHLS